jgi:hypothetical protein
MGKMTLAYEQTIEDFEIELCHTEWWRFKRIIWLNNQINYYSKLLDNEKN